MTDDRGKRRIRAKPAALAARGLCDCGDNGSHQRRASCPPIADGTQPGNEMSPAALALQAIGRSALASPELAASVARADLDVRTAERDRALDVVDHLERIITAIGGYMPHADQQWLREACALLVEHGRRSREDVAPWANRG